MSTVELRERTYAAMRGPDAERAHALAVELCQAEPENYEHQQIAGVTGLSSGRADEAAAHFAHAIRLAGEPPAAAAAWGGIGQACLLREDPEEAETAFRRALSLAPLFAPAAAGLAEALLRRGRHSGAEKTALRARELGENNARLQVTLGQALLGQDKVDEAEKAFEAARALDPEAPEPRFSLGTVAKVRGRIEEAQKIYREVLAADPEYPGYGQFAELKTFGAEDEDIALMQRCLASLPATAPPSARSDLHFALAKAWDDVGDIAQASA
ncbi:MAG: tetratricopeptide repeat protein, partial [Gammaproteobacteria bacterium]